ncbi:hypothetical protein [Bacillus sp. ISL-57]|uniref:hypothetical protein n=1 Tax=Bacillus sp. ISL-57 TaxID=2819135 RepID=UPI001BE62D48|nr:hypothetical protein [Bacillus sp. ISL-57]
MLLLVLNGIEYSFIGMSMIGSSPLGGEVTEGSVPNNDRKGGVAVSEANAFYSS